MNKILIITFSLIFSVTSGFSQTDKVWSLHRENDNKITTDKAVVRQSFPKEFKLFDLDINPLRQELFSVIDNNSNKHTTIISLPNSNGNIEQFEIVEASNFEPDLQSKFTKIRAFSGKGITDKNATLKLSISPQGIQAMIFKTEKENEFIEAYSKDHTIYAVFKSQRNSGKLPWTCSTTDRNLMANLNMQILSTNKPSSSIGDLKTMRLAQSCNGEYANYFGATSAAQVGLVLAAYNATLTRCNGVYEKDLAVHLNLIAKTTDVIFYDRATDPYTTLSEWNLQLQQTLTAKIGEANYDIGHMFGASGGGGNAGCIGCVCVSPDLDSLGVPIAYGKGSGITSPADGVPQGDNFDIDYVAHEIGHQLGANHTFSFSNEGTGVQKEIGSGITIMGYAGITNQDVAAHSIDIFHEASIQQIQNNLATKSCPITINISAINATPVVAAVPNYTIPISTPFALTGSASDANAGDVLTYCWEQNDNSTTTGNSSVASPTKLTGPNWLSFSPTVSPVRIFPRLTSILAGSFTTGPLPGGDAIATIEALSSVARTLNFRLTVRDNATYSSTAPIKVGQTSFTDMVVTVTNSSGPFQVTSPNTNVSYAGGSAQTITWDVNNTTMPPVSCSNVKISYSTDGGLSFPKVLAVSTANDGAESVIIPVGPTTTGRIKVEAIGNIFFDISDLNFSVNTGAIITAQPFSQTACVSNAATFSVTATGTGLTYQWQKALAATPTVYTDIPGATNSSYTTPATVPADNGNLYRVNIVSTDSPTTITTSNVVMLTVINPVLVTQNPLPQSGCAMDNYTFSVTATGGNLTYQWQVSTDGGATYINVSPGVPSSAASSGSISNYTITNALISLSGNFYRVVVSGQPCGFIITPGVLLTLSKKPTVDIAAAVVSNTNAAVNSMIIATVNPGNLNIIYSWKRNGAIIPNTLTSSFITLAVDDEAAYQLTVTDISTGCQSTSNTINTLASKSDNLIANRVFIYPNPVRTTMQVRYNNSTSANRGTMLNIYDEKGVRVFSKAYAITGTFGRMDVDMSGMQNGTYMIYIMDNSGKKLGGSKVIKIN